MYFFKTCHFVLRLYTHMLESIDALHGASVCVCFKGGKRGRADFWPSWNFECV